MFSASRKCCFLPETCHRAENTEWIAKLLRCGLIEPIFVPSEDIRELRDLCRLRKKRVHTLTAEKKPIQKYLESCNIKLGTFISDVFVVFGRKLLQRLVEQGYVDEKDIEECANRKIKKKTAEHLSSWAGVAPGNYENAGKKSMTCVKGNPHAKVSLCEAAWAIARSRNNRLATKFWKIASRRGKKKACIAIPRTILVISYHMFKNKQNYIEEGPPPFALTS